MQNTINSLLDTLRGHNFMYEDLGYQERIKGNQAVYDIRMYIRDLRSMGMMDEAIHDLMVGEFPVLATEDYKYILRDFFPPRAPKPGDKFIHTKMGMTRSARMGSIDTTYQVTSVVGDTCECTDLETGAWKSMHTHEVAWLISQMVPESL